ncbi:AraC family transcriptional regulator [Nocardioides sp. NPDC051685]|uniref:AraC family transcriptional regulator n=1 Tax=Nocardioides sp. NPDC051685 TaxID=3364334 RepID=UPI0037B8AE42
MTMTELRSAPTFAPKQGLSFDELHARWRDAVHDRLAPMDLRSTRAIPEVGSLEARDLGDLLITDWQSTEIEGVRRSSTAKNDACALVLFTVTTGRLIIQTPERTVVLRPGVLLVMSTRATGNFVVPESATKRTVRVPLTALAPYDTGVGVPDFLLLDTRENRLAQLAQDFMSGVDAQLDRLTPTEVEGARDALMTLIAGMIRSGHAPDVSETDFLPFLRKQMEGWIADHLTKGVIRVGDLAAAYNVAARTVHRAFAATGDTMGSVVRAQRLAAARNDLVHTSASVAAIAHRWGFCDASHLGREFRREFAMSPGDYRAAHGIV